MKKYLPFVLLLVGILVLVGVVLIIRGRSQSQGENVQPEEEIAPEIPADKKPFASLIPKSDGHWLKLRIENIQVPDAITLDYELLYKTGDGRTQGVPGAGIMIKGVSMIERDLLLGSESSGKFRYDVGVEKGTLTLRFRNDKGKLVGKLVTEFHLQEKGPSLSSVDGKFKYELDKAATGVWFVTMMPFGVKQGASNVVIAQGDYIVFSSDGLSHSGKVD